jgi:glycosyltransferase involved in cell wall biosynthesis
VFSYYEMRESFRLRFLPGGSGPIGQSRFLWSLAQLLPRAKPDVVYSRWSPAALAATTLGFRAGFEAHLPPHELGMSERAAIKALALSPQALDLVVTSAALRELYAAERPWTASRILVAPPGGETALGRPRVVWPGRLGALQVVHTGPLTPGRSIERLIALAERCPDVDFHIPGGSEAEVRAGREAGRGYANLRFYGFVAHRDVLHLMRQSDLLLAPHGEPMTLADCLASGRATIGLDLPANRALVGDEAVAYVASDAPEAWAAALTALRDPELRRELGARGEGAFRSRLTWPGRARRVLGDEMVSLLRRSEIARETMTPG